ncbi:MAG: MFS transporter [Chloroflexi bacterium]|nr:MFS transporter [Chloroflexota bacterium]MDA8189722.1 MFS transporter [Dehalococcoidales bacterium]
MIDVIWPVWLGRNLTLLFAQRGLRSLTQAYLIIIVPIYLARLEFGAIEIGFLFTASAVSSALLTAAVGLLSDRYGRKLFLILFAMLTSIGALIFALSTDFLVLAVAAAASTLGRGGGAGSGGAWGPFYPAEQALLAEQAGERDRTTIFSAVSFVGVLAGALGSLFALLPAALGLWLGLSLLDGDRVLFAITVGLGIAMTIMVLPVRERITPRPKLPGPRQRWSLSPRTLDLVLRFAATNFTNGLAIGLLGPLLVYWFHRRYGVGGAELGSLFFLVNLATAPSYLLAPRLTRMLGAVNTVVTTRAISVILLAVLAVMPTYLLAAGFYLARMVAVTLSTPVRQSYLMGIVDPRERASAAGLSSLPSQVASSTTPALAGYTMQTISLDLPLELAAFLQAINTALYYLFFRKIRPPEEMPPAKWEEAGPDNPDLSG